MKMKRNTQVFRNSNCHFYTMSNIIMGNNEVALKYAADTIITAIALAFGIVIVILWVRVVKHIKKHRLLRKQSKAE